MDRVREDARRRRRGAAGSIARLILVSGSPAAGKTMLAKKLASRLGLPVIAKDDVKERLYDTLGAGDVEWSGRLGAASYAILHAVVRELVAAGSDVILESNFKRGVSEPQLAWYIERATVSLLHVDCAPDVVAQRYRERAAGSDRHPGHLDALYADQVARDLAAGAYEPLDLPVPVIRIDATDGYTPSLDIVETWLVHASPR